MLARLETRQGRLEGVSGALGELRVEPALAPTLDLERLIGQTEAVIKERSRRQQERELWPRPWTRSAPRRRS